jgi:hypothetical protein
VSIGTYILAVDWDDDGSFSDAESDVTARTFGVEYKRGRNYASQLVGETISGVLKATLNNESGDYSSFNTSSPIYGKILPGRKVKLTGNDGSTTYTLWEGFLERIEPVVSARSAEVANMTCIGPLGYLNRFEVSTEMQTSIKTGAAVTEVLDEAGWPAGDRDIDTGIVTMPHFWADRKTTFAALRTIEDTESGVIEEAADGDIRFRDRHARSVDTRSTTSQATYSDASDASLPYTRILQLDPLQAIFNDLRGELATYTGVWTVGADALGTGTILADAPAVIWTLSESGPTSPSLAAGQVRIYTAISNSGVDSWADLVATTDYTANDAIDGSGTNRTSSISIATVKKSQSIKLTITNGHSGTVYLTKLQARGNQLVAKDKVSVGAEDATSQGTYGKRTFPHPGSFMPDTDEIQNWADFHVSVWKDPVPLLRLNFAANRSTAGLTDAYTRDLSDLVTVEADNNAGLGIDTLFFFLSVVNKIDSMFEHTVQLTLSEAAGYSGFFIVGSSSLGASTRLAY